MIWVAFFILAVFAGYWFYGKKLEKTWGVDIYRSPDISVGEENYSRISVRYIQLAYFIATLSSGCLISTVTGYLYGIAYVFWCVVGTMFFGGILSYYGGMYSVRNGGKTIIYAFKQTCGAFCHYLVVIFLLAAISLLMSSLASEFVNINNNTFNIPIKVVMTYGVLFCMFICCCPPRQAALIYGSVGIFALLMLSYMILTSFKYFDNIDYSANGITANGIKRAYPMIMFLCSVGTVNCLQGLQSSLFAPLIKNEKMGKAVFFGGIMLQAAFIILFSAIILAWNPLAVEYHKTLIASRVWYTVLQNTAYNMGGSFVALLLFCLVIALLFTFCGGLLRTARNLIADTSLGFNASVSSFIAICLVFLPALFLSKYTIPSPYFVLTSQGIMIISIVALLIIFIKDKRRMNTILFPFYVLAGADIFYVCKVFAKLSENTCYRLSIGITALLFILHYYLKNHKKLNRLILKIMKENAVRQKNALGIIRRDWKNLQQNTKENKGTAGIDEFYEEKIDIKEDIVEKEKIDIKENITTSKKIDKKEKSEKMATKKHINKIAEEENDFMAELDNILAEPVKEENSSTDILFDFDDEKTENPVDIKPKKKRKKKKKPAEN